MRKSDMIKLIHSLHYRHGLEELDIFSTCLDIVGYDKANEEVGSEINTYVNQVFSECDEGIRECWAEQNAKHDVDKEVESVQLDTTIPLISQDDNVIHGYFK